MVNVKGCFGLAYWLPIPAEKQNNAHQVILWDIFGMVKWPFQRLSDLQLGNQQITMNHQAVAF